MGRARSWVWRLVSGGLVVRCWVVDGWKDVVWERCTSKFGVGGGCEEGNEGGERRAATEGGAEHG